MDILGALAQLILLIIDQIGYLGIIVLMTLESVGIPIASEIVLPAGGWLAFSGEMNLWMVAASGTIGCIIGSAIAYYIGLWGGRAAVLSYGKYVHLNEGHLDAAELWFKSHGMVAIFVIRLLPVVRTYISFPAGMAKMRFWPFITVSAMGSGIWCFGLAYAGFLLGPRWDGLSGPFHLFMDIVLVSFGIIAVVWYYKRSRANRPRLL